MTRELLAFSRMQVLQPRLLDLNTTISEMNKMIPRLIGEHIQFSFTPESKILGTILADPGQVEQVFLNLAVNARWTQCRMAGANSPDKQRSDR